MTGTVVSLEAGKSQVHPGGHQEQLEADERREGRLKVALSFTLPPGAYATLLLKRLFGALPEEGTRARKTSREDDEEEQEAEGGRGRGSRSSKQRDDSGPGPTNRHAPNAARRVRSVQARQSGEEMRRTSWRTPPSWTE